LFTESQGDSWTPTTVIWVSVCLFVFMGASLLLTVLYQRSGWHIRIEVQQKLPPPPPLLPAVELPPPPGPPGVQASSAILQDIPAPRLIPQEQYSDYFYELGVQHLERQAQANLAGTLGDRTAWRNPPSGFSPTPQPQIPSDFLPPAPPEIPFGLSAEEELV
jgi:hypothetical protein